MSRPRTILVLTRHTPLPWEDGAGAYLFDILRFLRSRGFTIHVGWLAPHDHLRWQGVWTLPPEFAHVAKLHAPGAVRLGRRLFFPGVYWFPLKARALNLAKRILSLVGIKVGRQNGRSAATPSSPARAPLPPSAVDSPPTTGWMAVPSPDEHAFAAELIARLRPSSIVANYAWMTPLFADTPSDLVAHRVCLHPDVAWQRSAQLAALDGEPPAITAAAEASLLRDATVIVTISAADACELRKLAPDSDLVLAPKSVAPQPAPAPTADDARLLFVGSGNSFNAAGLTWFLEQVWPLVRVVYPTIEIDICGSIADAVGLRPEGARFHGAVPDLEKFYRNASLVVVPLRHATGLNIKLVDAAARGRAIVATPATLAGAPFLRDAVAAADTPADFASAVVDLLADPAARDRLAALSLVAVREHLKPEACYATLAAALST